MVGIADTPLNANRPRRRRAFRWALACSLTILVAALAWGSSGPIHLGNANGVEVRVEIDGYHTVGDRGEFVFPPGSAMRYTVRAVNRGFHTVTDMEIQSSLHSDGAACGDRSLTAGSLLPGAALSVPQRKDLSPSESLAFDASYPVPTEVCGSGHLKVRVNFVESDQRRSTSLVSPVHFAFK